MSKVFGNQFDINSLFDKTGTLGTGINLNKDSLLDLKGVLDTQGSQIGDINTALTKFEPIDLEALAGIDLSTLANTGDVTSNSEAIKAAQETANAAQTGIETNTGGISTNTGRLDDFDFNIQDILGQIGTLGGQFDDFQQNFGGSNVPDWLDDLGNLPIFGGGSEGGSASATATGGEANNFLQDLIGNITQNAGDILSGGINFYGQKEAAEAYRDAAKEGIASNEQALAQLRGDLDPFREMGVNAIPGAVDAATTNLQTPDQPLDVFQGYNNIQDLYTDSNLQFSGDSREGLDPLSANVGGWDQFAQDNLIQRGGDQWNLLQDDARVRAENMSASRGRLNTQEARDSSLKSMLRNTGEMENINQSRLNQELARRGSDFGISSGARGQLFGEDFDLGSRRFGEGLSADQLQGSEARANRQSQMGQQITEADARFSQQSQRRDQLWKELLGEDAQSYEKLMGLVGLGQNSAAQTGSGAVNLAGYNSRIYNDMADVQGTRVGEQFKNLGDIFGGLF